MDDTHRPNIDVCGVTVKFDEHDRERFAKIARAHYRNLDVSEGLQDVGNRLAQGDYISILQKFHLGPEETANNSSSVKESIQAWVKKRASASSEDRLEVELLAIASLNLFLQNNYTGPALQEEDDALTGIHPHPVFAEALAAHDSPQAFQNAVLAELSIDGQWPCPLAKYPYFLLLARTILSTLTGRTDWMRVCTIVDSEDPDDDNDDDGVAATRALVPAGGSAYRWSARAVVAHQRLLQSGSTNPSVTLWKEAEATFHVILQQQQGQGYDDPTAWLEWGLAEHHFNRPDNGKRSFQAAVKHSGLTVHVTGAIGKRTKFQTKATAQMLVIADSATTVVVVKDEDETKKDTGDPAIKSQMMIEHPEDGILLERINFEDKEEHDRISHLSMMDQSILLALCLDVKNSNPADGLTGEEMGAFLARILEHHDDWMIYSTALLERAWLEFERSHARERAILQIQALADQHTDRLTITQSTRESIESSAPVQQRLENLHYIVYPPRWAMIQDLAERYAALGIVTSAAELFTEIELWDSVVACYRRAGRTAFAEKVVRERLENQETPRMWAALGDLTKDPEHYRKAIALSKGRFADAYLALAEYHFGQGELDEAAKNFEAGLKVQPLNASAWFRLGTISMQVKNWERSLQAFSEVVMQKSDEAEAWANIAAIHLHHKRAEEAFPALNEALKYQRSNWRIWVSKLYTCLDLERYDEAIQACTTLLDRRSEKKASQGVPFIEEKCVRGIVGGVLKQIGEAGKDDVSRDSLQRSLARTHALLMRLSSVADVDDQPWILEIITFFNAHTATDTDTIVASLMNEYRAMQSINAWEKDIKLVTKVCEIVYQIGRLTLTNAHRSRQELTKSRYTIRGVVTKIELAQTDTTGATNEAIAVEVRRLKDLSSEISAALSESSPGTPSG